MANLLFVAFHGLVCLVDGGKKGSVDRGFKAYVLRDGDNAHKQVYGDFLAEQDFAPVPGGSFPVDLEFSGLNSGADTLKPEENPVVQLTDFPSDTSNVLAIFTLPRPNAIHYALQGVVMPGMLVDPGNRVIQTQTKISQIRFFEYDLGQQPNVKLFDSSGNAIWECPPLATAGNDNIAVFHVYDEPPQTINPKTNASNHNISEFKESMDFMKADVQITSAAQVDPGSFQSPHPNGGGVLPEELAALDVRQKGLIQFVHDRRIGTGRDLGGAGGTQVCGGGNGLVP
jgi:hypothetical protein